MAPVPALAVIVGGGGAVNKDCLAVFQGPANTPAGRPRYIRCTDGDTSCDADGVANGECEFQVGVCANSTFSQQCTPTNVQSIVVDHAADNGDPRFDTEFQALQTRINNQIHPPSTQLDRCTTPTNLHVKLKGPFPGNRCATNSKRIRMVTVSSAPGGRQVVDIDAIRLVCRPSSSVCLARDLYDGTFDRIQRQIFNQHCAVSSCHDSQSKQANLLLEAGASYNNLVNVDPTNAAAFDAGWKRVTVIDPSTGDSSTSFLFHKVNGDLQPGFGARMPFGGIPLTSNLIDAIQLWIDAGAPQTGWVPGTDQ
jgi:hypothetical protein